MQIVIYHVNRKAMIRTHLQIILIFLMGKVWDTISLTSYLRQFVKRMGLDRMKPLLKIMSDYYHCTTETPSEEVCV